MTTRLMQRLLGTGAHDPGCDASFEILDQYVKAVLRGDDAASLFPGVAAHLQQCDACREDTDDFMAVLGDILPGQR